MFDYNSSETIINSLTLENGSNAWTVLDKVADPSQAPVAGEDPMINYFGGDSAFFITRGPKFIDTCIKQVYRNPFVNGVLEKATGTVPAAGMAAGTVYRLVIDLILDQGSQSAEYARWAIHKGKPIMLEARSLTALNQANSAVFLANAFNAGLKKANIDEKELTIASSGNNITVEVKSTFVRIKFIAVEELSAIGYGVGYDMEGDPASYFIAFDPTISAPAAGKFYISTKGVSEFGTYHYMISNLRMPTVEQVRFGGVFQDQLPIPGAKYTQFTITYEKERQLTGTNALGAPATSRTTHVYYVLDTGVAANTNPAHKFWADLLTVATPKTKQTNVPDALTRGATNDGILESTVDNPPVA